jgi:thiamine biosynthesis protein ThiS
MITVFINNEATLLEAGLSLQIVVDGRLSKSLAPFCAVAVNRCFVSRERYAQTILQDQDTLDLVIPMQGG